jgi:hypothetical protein
MSIFKKSILPLILSASAVLPAAAAEGIVGDGTAYSREQSQKYMQNRGPATTRNNGLRREFFLQERRPATGMRQESPPGFGG